MFSGINNTLKKSQAAVVVQGLLEQQARAGQFDLPAAKFANELVRAAWSYKPQMFSGKDGGPRPHKITVAAMGLATGIHTVPESNLNRYGLILALGNLLAELERNGGQYSLNGRDHALLESAAHVFRKVTEEPDSDSADGGRTEPEPKVSPETSEKLEEAGKKMGAVGQKAFSFAEAAMMLPSKARFESKQARIGAAFFICGATDFLAQKYDLSDLEFESVLVSVLQGIGLLSEEQADNFVGSLAETSKMKLGQDGMYKGAVTVSDWFGGKDDYAPLRLFDYMKEWASESSNAEQDKRAEAPRFRLDKL